MAGSTWLFPSFRSYLVHKNDGNKETDPHTAEFMTATIKDRQISWEIEQQLRFSTCMFAQDLANLVEIPEAPAITAQLYIQKFYMMHSFAIHDRFLVATAALFLAGKVEEFPIKVRLMTECALYLLHCNDDATDAKHKAASMSKKRKALGDANTPQASETTTSISHNPEAANAKHLDCLHALLEVLDVGVVEITATKVLLMERILLQTLGFEVAAPTPLAYVAPLMDKLFALDAMHTSASYSWIRQMAVMFLHDAIKNGLVLAFTAVELAAGGVYLSGLYLNQISKNVTVEESNAPWWSVLGVDATTLEQVAMAMRAMYGSNAQRSDGLSELWTRISPNDNLPDLDYVQSLNAQRCE